MSLSTPDIENPNNQKTSLFRGYWWLLLYLLYFPLLFMGYGSDLDTFKVINTWPKYLAANDYVPSRLPGYVIHEYITYLVTQIDGSILSNSLTLAFAILAGVFLSKILRKTSIPVTAVLLMVLNPVFIICATSTVDYTWALGCFLVGIYLFMQKKVTAAGVLLGLSAAIRLTYGLLALGVFLFYLFLYGRENRRSILQFVIAALIILAINLGAYYLPLDFTEWELKRFFTVSMGDPGMWTPVMRVGRWGYKNLVVWGLPVVLVMLGVILSQLKRIKAIFKEADKRLFWVSCLLLLLVEGLFLLFPIEVEYLLPLVPFTAILFGMLFKGRKPVLVLLAVFMFINGFYTLIPARPDVPNRATSAEIGLFLSPGYLLEDIALRLPLKDCSTATCYGEVKRGEK